MEFQDASLMGATRDFLQIGVAVEQVCLAGLDARLIDLCGCKGAEYESQKKCTAEEHARQLHSCPPVIQENALEQRALEKKDEPGCSLD
jgi:hypothetical protein